MKNIFKTFSVLLFGGLLFTSCDRTDDLAVAETQSKTEFSANALASSYVITNDNLKETISVGVQPATYTVSAGAKNELQVAVSGTNFANVLTLGTYADKAFTFTYSQLNDVVTSLGAKAGTAFSVDVRVKSYLSSLTVSEGQLITYSDVKTISVTPYSSVLYVTGKFQGWDYSTAHELVSKDGDGVFVGYLNFLETTSDGLEFRVSLSKNSSGDYYGTNDNQSLVLNGGSNLKATKTGYQKLTVDTNQLTFKLEDYSWGVIGDAQSGGWGADTDMVWNYEKQVWIADITLTTGEIKFRLNNEWGTNFGDDGADGTLDAGGANIKIREAGTYTIVLDLVNNKYTLTKK